MRRRQGTVVATLSLSLHVGEARMGEDKAWARRCRHHHVIVVACEGRRVRSGWVRSGWVRSGWVRSGWVRTRDGRGAVIALSLSLSLSSHVRVDEDEAWARRRCCCRVWREGGRGGYENPCCGYRYECGSARLYPYPYLRDTHHMTRAGYPYPWYTLQAPPTHHAFSKPLSRRKKRDSAEGVQAHPTYHKASSCRQFQ